MRDQQPASTSHRGDDTGRRQHASENHRPGPVDAACGPGLARIADAVASGEAGFPADVSPGEAELLIAEIARRRRHRLVQYVARTIALDIHRASGPSKES